MPIVKGGQGRAEESVVCAALVVTACLAVGGALVAALWFWKAALAIFG